MSDDFVYDVAVDFAGVVSVGFVNEVIVAVWGEVDMAWDEVVGSVVAEDDDNAGVYDGGPEFVVVGQGLF